MRRARSFIGTLVLGALLAACGVPDASSSSGGGEAPTTSAKTAQPATSTPWAGPTDGTWDYGDAELGQKVRTRLSDYEIRVASPPEFGPLNDDGKVTVSANLEATRVRDQGYGEPITESERVGFVPGNLSYKLHAENYGLRTDFACDRDAPQIGDVVNCTVSFTAPHEEMSDFHWWINGEAAAAFPGQKVTD